MKKFSMKYNRKSGKKIYIILALLAILLLSLCFLSFQKSTIEGMKGKKEKKGKKDDMRNKKGEKKDKKEEKDDMRNKKGEKKDKKEGSKQDYKNEKPVIINPVSMAMTAMKSFIPTYTENN